MERRLRENGEAKRNTVRSAERPSELSERLERLVRRCHTTFFLPTGSQHHIRENIHCGATIQLEAQVPTHRLQRCK